MERKAEYMNFPITLLRGAFNDINSTTLDIICYAIYKHSQNLKSSDELLRIKKAIKFFGINFYGHDDESVYSGIAKKGKSLNCSIKQGTPFVSVKTDTLWNMATVPAQESRTACFCAFCAIKSIVGDRDYVKSNKALITARMFGFPDAQSKEAHEVVNCVEAAQEFLSAFDTIPSSDTISAAIDSGQLKVCREESYMEIKKIDLIKWGIKYHHIPKRSVHEIQFMEKYSTRYHMDNLLIRLQERWHLSLYSDHTRGFYLSFKKSLEELAEINYQNKSKRVPTTTELALRKAKAKAKAKAAMAQKSVTNIFDLINPFDIIRKV